MTIRASIGTGLACFVLSGCPADDAPGPDDGGGTATGSTGGVGGSESAGDLDPDTAGVATDVQDESESGTADAASTGEMTDDTTGATTDESSGSTGEEICGVVLAEVVFDPLGGDDELQWVKLKNLCSYPIDLSEWKIGYGGEDYFSNGRVKQITGLTEGVQFETTIDGFGCYLLGGPTAAAANGDPIFNWPDDFAPGLENDIAVGSGVALFDPSAGEIDATSIPVDAVVYGPNNDFGLIDETGNPVAVPHVGLPPEGGSITRTSAAATWDQNVAPQALTCPVF